MSSFLLLIVCLLLGVAAARLLRTPPQLAAALNWWVLTIALPALVLSVVPRVALTRDLWFLVVAMWLVFGASWLFFAGLGRLLHWPPARIGALILAGGLGNTAFVGYPMIEALHGEAGLALAVVADQVGCFMMLAVGGAIVTAKYSGSRVSGADIARRVLLFPAFIALLVAIAAGAAGGWHPSVESVLHRLGDTLVPLALFSVGLQVHASFAPGQVAAVALGLLYKLALAPLLALGLGLAAGVGGLTLKIGVLQAAMAPMVSAAILAEQHDLEPRLAQQLLVAGIIVSLASVPAIDWLL